MFDQDDEEVNLLLPFFMTFVVLSTTQLAYATSKDVHSKFSESSSLNKAWISKKVLLLTTLVFGLKDQSMTTTSLQVKLLPPP